MPFDDRTFPSAEAAGFRRNRRRVAIWLFVVAGMIYGMVLLGGTTRLTGSGLSIMEWAPLSGALPPFSHHEWVRLFDEYKRIPQYALQHQGMALAGFKQIFWLEWIHRAWGRLIGVVFLLPLVWFAVTGALERRMVPRLVVLFLLGGLQGAVGWFMVASGFFPDSTSVSPYRLVIHLSLALLLFSAILWTALSTAEPVPISIPGAHRLRRLCQGLTALVALTIVAGGFTAGLHAGLEYNTFPLMDGRLIPKGYSDLHPALANLTANPIAVQFDHRLVATMTVITVLFAFFVALRTKLPRNARAAMWLLGGLTLVQYCLGIATLLSVVAIPLAVAHQATAVLVLAAALTATHSLRGAR
ncbi:MAG TPA: COX15/CtaA family protein [Acetobacteraceae bacterium]|nr:COX15/CtaA family protein [Acetobacteraceae bacterium]